MNRRHFLAGGVALASGCGGSGGPESVTPYIEVQWTSTRSQGRTSEAQPLIMSLFDFQCVAVTLVGASSKPGGGDVVLKGNRPALTTRPDGSVFYESTYLQASETVLQKNYPVIIDQHVGKDSSGRHYRATGTAAVFSRGGVLFDFSLGYGTYKLMRAKISGMTVSLGGDFAATVAVGTRIPLQIEFHFPFTVNEIYTPEASDIVTEPMFDPIVNLVQRGSDANGNPEFELLAYRPGTADVTLVADGVRSNALKITVVP